MQTGDISFETDIGKSFDDSIYQKVKEIIKAKTSATVIAHHIPSISKKIGRIITDAVWNTSALKNETVADIPPLLRAVKNEETNMLKPASRNEKEKSLKACIVRL